MIRGLLLLLLAAVLTACDHVSYYAQAVRGQAAILLARQSISDLLQNPQLDPVRREQLMLVDAARQFAEQQLMLPAQGSFTTFVDPGRDHLVWNVFAAPWNSVDLLNWCFPIAGCVGYRGYFSERAAHQYASRLAADGYDVYVGGVDAYSTLGWFRDPLPATVLRRDNNQLAGLIFHELAHQRVYLPGDTVFNESFASFVERQGLQLWLARRGQEHQVQQIVDAQQLQQRFAVHVAQYREQLRTLYDSDAMSRDEMANRKQQIIQAMREHWRSGPDAAAYGNWFASEINNAQMATVAAYFDYVPAFERLYKDNNGNFERFYEAVAALADLSTQERTQALQRLMFASGAL